MFCKLAALPSLSKTVVRCGGETAQSERSALKIAHESKCPMLANIAFDIDLLR